MKGWRFLRGNLGATASDENRYNQITKSFDLLWSKSLLSTDVFSASGDINGDGKLELVTVSGNEIRIFDAQGSVVENTIVLPVDSNPYKLVLDDIDNDDIPEIITGSMNSSLMQTFIYKANGVLVAKLTRTGSNDSKMFPVAYLGDDQLLVAYTTELGKDPRGYAVWNISAETESWYYDVGPGVGVVSVADVDGDNYKEFIADMFAPQNGAIGNGINGTGTLTSDDNLYSILIDETGEEQLVQKLGEDIEGGSKGGSGHILVDLDSDGEYEIIASIAHALPFFPGDAQIHILNIDGSLRHKVSVGNNLDPKFLISDLDNNGLKEIVVWSSVDASLRIYDDQLNLVKTRTSLGGSKFSAYIASDIDGDGTKEILAQDDKQLQVYDGNSLDLEWHYNFTDTINNIWTSELDNDQLAEIVITTNDGAIHELSTSPLETIKNITLVEKINSVVTNNTVFTKNIGEKISIIIKPKVGFQGIIYVDGVTVAIGNKNTKVGYRLDVVGNHLVETDLIGVQ